MYWDAPPPPAPQPEFSAEWGRLRPGVPVVRARGRLDRATVDELRRTVDRCLGSSPWAVVVDLTGVTELRAGAVPKLADLAFHARAGCVGLHLVTGGGAVDGLLRAAADSGLLAVHPSMAAAQRALGRQF